MTIILAIISITINIFVYYTCFTCFYSFSIFVMMDILVLLYAAQNYLLVIWEAI